MTQQFHAPFICVEGPIGVGKTSLATRLSNYFNYYLLEEIVSENPYLSKFYKNINEWSFQTEMFFLSNRYKQLENTYDHYLKKGMGVISDYHIMKSLLFTNETLSEHHREKFERIYRILTSDLPHPNIIIYLHADLPTLLQQTEKKDHSIDEAYLQQLSNDYEQFIKEHTRVYPHIPVLSFNCEKVDFIKNDDAFFRIVDQVEYYIHKQDDLFHSYQR